MLVELVFVKSDFFLSDDRVIGGLNDLRFIQFPPADIQGLHSDFSDPSQRRVLKS
jgi:hypothetical protein